MDSKITFIVLSLILGSTEVEPPRKILSPKEFKTALILYLSTIL